MAEGSEPTEAADEGIDARRLLTPEERAKMIARIHSLVYWVGMLVPEYELLEGSEVDLRQVVYNLTTKESLTAEDKREIEELITTLRKKARSLESRLSKDPLTVDTAKSLLEEICGLLRAVDELRAVETLDKAELRKREVMSRIDDARRWQKFVEAIKPPK